VRGGFLGKIEKTMTTLLLRPSTSGNWKISRVWLPGLSASELHLLSTLSETQGPSTALGMTMSGYTFAAFVVGTFAAINYRNP